MTQIILDTNFILTCIKQKIDFFEELKLMGLKIFIPIQVIREFKSMSTSSDNAQLALKLLEKNKFEEIDLKEKNVDKGLVKFAEKNKDVYIGTLDKELKEKILNSKVVIREKKRLEII